MYMKDAGYTIMKIHDLWPHGIFKERHIAWPKKKKKKHHTNKYIIINFS